MNRGLAKQVVEDWKAGGDTEFRKHLPLPGLEKERPEADPPQRSIAQDLTSGKGRVANHLVSLGHRPSGLNPLGAWATGWLVNRRS